MPSKTNRKPKIITVAAIAIVVVTGAVVGIVLGTKSNENGVSELEAFTESTDTFVTDDTAKQPDDENGGDGISGGGDVVFCPCYNGEDIDRAVAQITSGDASIDFDRKNTCTASHSIETIPATESISYFTNQHMMGYEFDNRNSEFLQCRESDVFHVVNEEEAKVCARILTEKCIEHKDTLNGLQQQEVPSGDTGENEPISEVETCPCFSSVSLESTVVDVNSNAITLQQNSCNEDSDNYRISYVLQTAEGYPEYHGWGVSSNMMDCQYHDTLMVVQTKSEWEACRKIVSDACISMGLNHANGR